MTNSIQDALATCVTDPPQDLTLFYASPPLVAPELGINVLTLEDAIVYTRAIRDNSYLGSPMGLFALDDANDSNPFCYITSGPAKGCILHLSHDDDARIAYSSLEEFVAALKTAIAEETFVDDLPDKNPRPALDQDQLCDRISELTTTDTDEATAELVFLTSLLDVARTETVRTLSAHADFYVREAVATLISQYPNVKLLEVADALASDPHPQVARPGKAALSAVQRVSKEA